MARSAGKSEAPSPAETATENPICMVCWPDGWPKLASAATCEHGEYDREAS